MNSFATQQITQVIQLFSTFELILYSIQLLYSITASMGSEEKCKQ